MIDKAGTRGAGWLALLILSAVACCWAPLRAEQSNQEQKRELTQRVDAYYSLEQAGRYKEAEALVLPASRDTYEAAQKGPFLGYKIESVRLDSEGKSAQVTVQVHAFVGSFASRPVAMPFTTEWRLDKGKWFMSLPKGQSASPSPFEYLSKEHPKKGAPKPELEFKGHHYNFAAVKPGQEKIAKFPFKNVSSHTVTITKVITGNPLLKVESYKKEYKPGESGELSFKFDPVEVKWDWAQTIVVKTDPGNQINYLTVVAYVTPPPRVIENQPSEDSSSAIHEHRLPAGTPAVKGAHPGSF